MWDFVQDCSHVDFGRVGLSQRKGFNFEGILTWISASLGVEVGRAIFRHGHMEV